MLFNREARKSGLILLIEHLDAVLFAIEGLDARSLALPPPEDDASARDIHDYLTAVREFVSDIHARELSLIAHVDRARRQAARLKSRDGSITAYARLFNAGTQAFADRLEDLTRAMESDLSFHRCGRNACHRWQLPHCGPCRHVRPRKTL